MEKQEELTIVLRASHLARLKSIKNELLNILEGTDEATICYAEEMSLEQLATICFTRSLSSEAVLIELKDVISMHVLFNSILNRQ